MHDEEGHVAGVTVIRAVPDEARAAWQFVYAPGAGSHVHDPFGTHAAELLAGRGVSTVRFQFPYQEAGSRRPDRPPVLEATWLAVLDACHIDGVRLIAGGRSMGGRIASVVASKGAPLDGLALFAYPLHPPKRPELARTAHLAAIPVPALFCSGTRDAFGTVEEIEAAAAMVPDARVHVLDGADHGFAVLKSTDRTRYDVWDDAAAALLAWATERFHA
jgi:predicted alpha/beta-hydrolase family hydrolase